MDDPRVVDYDVTRSAVVNGETFELFQTCVHCNTKFIGNYNFKFCPECGEFIAHVEEVR